MVYKVKEAVKTVPVHPADMNMQEKYLEVKSDF